MQFNSLTFVVFFALICAGYYALPNWTARKALLVLASFVFYAAWNPLYVLLLWFSTIADWRIAQRINASEQPARRRNWLILSLGVNLGLLGYFKYGEFLLDAFIQLAARSGVDYAPPPIDILLPVGISFYTFQTLSYTLDIYRRQLTPSRSLLDFALFVGFFPQLVAGPIVRASHFLPQCLMPKRFSLDAFSWGATLIVFGLFAKVALADSVFAPVADAIFGNPGNVSMTDAWIGVFAFSGQIFLDFSGYSLCAIGAALCLGFALPDNFRTPYAAIGFSDFWSRWHISLSTWLRDYLYIALGGNRGPNWKVYRNLLVTMLLGGLWHGAAWTFVLWGALHGSYLIIERWLKRVFPVEISSDLFKLGLGLSTFVIVSITWVFFRSPTFEAAGTLLHAMLVQSGDGSVAIGERALLVLISLVGLLGWHCYNRNSTLEARFAKWPTALRAAVIAAATLGVIFSSGGEQHAFIYFQF